MQMAPRLRWRKKSSLAGAFSFFLAETVECVFDAERRMNTDSDPYRQTRYPHSYPQNRHEETQASASAHCTFSRDAHQALHVGIPMDNLPAPLHVATLHPADCKKGEPVKDAFACQSHALLALGLHAVFGAPPRPAAPGEQARTAFARFIAMQIAHNADGVAAMLWDAPDFLWVARGRQVRGVAAAMALYARYCTGTWKVEPVMARCRTSALAPGLVQILVPVTVTRGGAGRIPHRARSVVCVLLTCQPGGWRIASVLPVAGTDATVKIRPPLRRKD
jgi:hypothetical protein